MMWLLAVVDGFPARVRTVHEAGLTAAGLPDDSSSPASTDLLLRHAEVVGSLLGSCPAVLPVRAGTRLPEHDVRRLLHDRQDELRHGLRRVRGAVELAVRCHPTRPDGTERATDGREYLEHTVQRWRWAEDAARRAEALGRVPGVREVRLLARAPAGVKASLLVEAALAEDVRRQVLSELAPLAHITCTGPFPAYSFTTAPADAA